MISRKNSQRLLIIIPISALYSVLLFSLTSPDLTEAYFNASYNKYRYTNDSSNAKPVFKIFLIGDAGDPDPLGEPVLTALGSELAKWGDSAVVIFLGDNIYPAGLTDSSSENRNLYEQKILSQITSVVSHSASAYFIPGNHDWNNGAEDGLMCLNQQEEFVNSFNDLSVRFINKPGCPDPKLVETGNDIALLFLDTQSLIKLADEDFPRPDFCKVNSFDDFTGELDSLLNLTKKKFTIIAGHHPIESNGPHGGYFTWKNHLFPLLELNSYLWIPLPLIGSLYPAARIAGISEQDLSSNFYSVFINNMKKVLVNHRNVIYVSGHEHSLQVLKSDGRILQLVSGSGIYGHQNPVTTSENTIFAGAVPGFMAITFCKDKSIVLEIIEVEDKNGNYSIAALINLSDLSGEIN
ncbi:MAG: hypothetical protein Kow0098_16280 [Ignavibacteriaceae bacterium]